MFVHFFYVYFYTVIILWYKFVCSFLSFNGLGHLLPHATKNLLKSILENIFG